MHSSYGGGQGDVNYGFRNLNQRIGGCFGHGLFCEDKNKPHDETTKTTLLNAKHWD